MRFTSVLELHGKTATGIAVPDEVVAALGMGKRPAVTVTLGGHSYRTSIAPMGGTYLIPVAAEHREAAGLVAGQTVEVDVEPDTAPRTVEVPDALAAALDAAGARAAFDSLSFTARKEHARSVADAKTDATRLRRIDKILAALTP